MLARVPGELALLPVVVVVVIRYFYLLLLWSIIQSAAAAVLPDDRLDLLYHSYDGGGVEVTGPSILVRKSVGSSVSAYYNYYADNISSASIDVVAGASRYHEAREENSVGMDYLHDKSTMSIGYTSSQESDYDADTLSLSFSQDMFGDLTTISFGFSKGNNLVRRNGDSNFEEDANSRSYRVSLSQILTKDLLMGVTYEAIADEGFLNNPYRSVRYVDGASPVGFSYQSEVYPGTRTSNAAALRLRYYLPHRASIYGGYHYFSDTWGIGASTFNIGYVHPFGNDWLFDINWRSYSQNNADFYSDLFPALDAQNFLARDKELSTFNSSQLELGLSYAFAKNGWEFIDKGSLNFYYNRMLFDYKDFRDVTLSTPATVGNEPLYSFSANVLRVFISLWY